MFSLRCYSILFLIGSLSLCWSQEEPLSEAAEWSERLKEQFQTVGGYRATYDGRKGNKNFRAVVTSLSDHSQLWAKVEVETDEGDQVLYWLANNDDDTAYISMNGVCVKGMKHMKAISERSHRVRLEILPDSKNTAKEYEIAPQLNLDKTSINCSPVTQSLPITLWANFYLDKSKSIRKWQETIEFDTLEMGKVRINRETGFLQQQILENEKGERRTLKLLKLETDLSDETLLDERPPFPEKVETCIDVTKDSYGLPVFINMSFGFIPPDIWDDEETTEELEARLRKAGVKFGEYFLLYEPMKLWLKWATTDPSMETYSKWFYEKEGEDYLAENLATYFNEKNYLEDLLSRLGKDQATNNEKIAHSLSHFLAGYVARSWVEKFREDETIKMSETELGREFLK